MTVRSRVLRSSNIQPKTKVARLIHDTRRAAQLSHDRLAERVGISRQHLIHLEWGNYGPRPDVAQRLSEALGIPLEELLSSTDDEEDRPMAILIPVTLEISREHLDEALMRALREHVRNSNAPTALPSERAAGASTPGGYRHDGGPHD